MRKALAVLAVLLLAGCGETPPRVEFAGAGFIFNYRIAEAYYGVVLRVKGDMPAGATIEVRFENPAGGAPFAVTDAVTPNRLEYSFRTPGLSGVRKDTDYRVTARLLAAGQEIARADRTVRSELDQSALPEKPLTVGPGYQTPGQ